MNLSQFQGWLNNRGAGLVVDGKSGPATRAAILKVFSNKNAPAITAEEIEAFGERLDPGGEGAKKIRAVGVVEGAGKAYNNQGQPLALYERHYAWRRLRILIPLLSNPAPGGYTIDADNDGLNDSWEKIADMAMRNPLVAFESASFGKFQVMGAWGTKLGYANAIMFAWSMTQSEAAHYEALVRYIEKFDLVQAFRRLSGNPLDCVAFARGYNGPGQKGYDQRLARAMR